MYKNLFSPITINKLEIKNRIAYPALGVLYSYDRKLNDRYYNYFSEKARGGAGIVTVGPVGVDFIKFAKIHCAPYEVPKIIEFIDEIPLTAVGKVDKKVLRKKG